MIILIVPILQGVWALVADQTPTPAPIVDESTRNALLALAMGGSIFFSSLALGIAYGIRRKIDSIAGPPPEDDDKFRL